MNQFRCFGLAALAAIALVTPALAGDPAQNGYRLRVKETKGATYSYRVSFCTNLDMSGVDIPAEVDVPGLKGEQSLVVTGRFDFAVQKVEKGKVTLKRTLRLTGLKGTGVLENAAKSMDEDKVKSDTIVLDELGRRVGGTAKPFNSPFDYGEIPFPVAPVYPGQKWTLPPVPGSNQQTPTTLLCFGTELVNGKETLRFELSGIDLAGLTCKGPFVIYVDPANGRTERMEGIIYGEQMGATIRVRVSMDLVH